MDINGSCGVSTCLPQYGWPTIRGRLVERVIPAWGLYRLFSALERKGASGQLTLHFPDGVVRFTLNGGALSDCWTDVDGLSFPEFLVQSGMVQDRAAARSFTSVGHMVSASIVRAADAGRIHSAYVREVVDIILPVPVQSWAFEPAPAQAGGYMSEPLDLCAELFVAVRRSTDSAGMRSVMSRIGTFARLTDVSRQGCLASAASQFPGVPLMSDLGNGHCPPLMPAVINDDASLRILFGLVVAGGLVSAESGAGTLSEAPVSTVSVKPSDVDFDEFRVPQPGHVHPAHPAAPTGTGSASFSTVAQGPSSEESLDLDVVPDVRVRGGNFRRDDYLVMDDAGTIQGFTSVGTVKEEMKRGITFVDPELDRAIQAELARAAKLNNYELLEIGPEARVSAVRMAVLRTRRRYSPSRYEGGISPDSMKALQALIERIGKVGELLSDLNLRVAYNRSQNISTPGLEAQLAAMFEARGYWRQGMQLLEERKAAEALELFEAAENCDAEEPDYFCAQGQALLAMAPGPDTGETIESLLDVSFSFDPDLVGAHLLAADYMVRKNDIEAAQGHIRKVLALDPDSREARAFRMKVKASKVAGQVSFKKKPESLLERAMKLVKR